MFARLVPIGALLLVLVLSSCGEPVRFGVARTPITLGGAGEPATIGDASGGRTLEVGPGHTLKLPSEAACLLLAGGPWCGPVLGATLVLPPVTVTAGTTPPPPKGAVVSQIHNAPGWRPNQAYAPATGPFTRVNSGPGWDPATGTWKPGLALSAYQLTSAACTSGTTMPTGTGTAIQDGSCTWRFLSRTDYISITGWSSDNKAWVSGVKQNYHDVVTSDSPLRAYMQISTGCTSTIRPAGTGATYSMDGEGRSLGLGSDGCQWVYFADVLYSSMKTYVPTQTFAAGVVNGATVNLLADHVGDVWNDREYVAGQNGEKSPIEIVNHNEYYGEGLGLTCAVNPCPHVVIRAAPGEGFADSMGPADPLTGYDPTKGASILNNDGWRWPVDPAGLFVENFVDVIGLQIKSTNGEAVGDIRASYNNKVTVQGCILDGGRRGTYATPAVVSMDTSGVVANSLLIAHGNAGIIMKYPGFVLHNTIISADGTGDVGIETGSRWVFKDTTVADNVIFGFAHAGAGGPENTGFDPSSANNVTDAPVGDAGLTTWMGGLPANEPVVTIPGTTYGVSPAAALVNPGSDYRVKPGGPLAGKGGAYGTFGLNCPQGGFSGWGADLNCAQRINVNFDSPDVIGTVRPQGGGYDIGAWQTPH